MRRSMMHMEQKIFVFGNQLLEEDSLPLKLLPFLRKTFPDTEFIEFDPTGNLSELGRNPVIIDTVHGIKETIVIKDTDQISTQKAHSLHDFDLGINLKLMKKTGMIDSVKILGVPMGMDKEKAKKELTEKLKENELSKTS